MATVFLNGEFVARADARVSAFDAGFQHAVGLFETLTAVRAAGRARLIHAPEHVDRLVRSARELGLSETLRAGALAEAVQRTADRAAADFPSTRVFRLRLTITGGDMSLLEQARAGGGESALPTVLIVAQPAPRYPDEMFEKGVSVLVAGLRVNPLDPFAGHKTLNYWPRLRELQLAAAARASEALVFQVTNHLAGGCVSNALVVRAGRLLTPVARGEEAAGDAMEAGEAGRSGVALPSPVLPGVVRRWAIDWAESEGIEVETRMLTIDDVFGAEEVLLTNSSWGVLPIVRVESHGVGGGAPGPVARELRAAWLRLLDAGPSD